MKILQRAGNLRMALRFFDSLCGIFFGFTNHTSESNHLFLGAGRFPLKLVGDLLQLLDLSLEVGHHVFQLFHSFLEPIDG